MRMLMVTLAALLLSCCAQVTPRMVDADAVTVEVGEEVRVLIGPDNPSIGWNYFLVEGEGNGHAGLRMDTARHWLGGDPGSAVGDVYVEVTGETPGEFTFTMQRCLRTLLDDCDSTGAAERKVVRVTVVE